MSRPIPPHGTMARRKGTKSKSRPPCHCQACLAASSRDAKTGRLLRARGVSGTVPSDAAAAHVQRLLDSGRLVEAIAREAEVSPVTVWNILGGRPGPILRRTEEKLLAVKPLADEMALVDSTGTVRRLRALVAIGHTQNVLASEVGCTYTYISELTRGRCPLVSVALERDVRRAYRVLWMRPGSSEQARQRAQRYGWYGPLAWDDDTIDDPAAVPQTDAEAPAVTEGGNVAARWLMGEAVILDQAARKEALQHLFEWSADPAEEIAARLDMSPDAASRAWERMKVQARQEGRTLRRRRYVPRARTIQQNEMGEAA